MNGTSDMDGREVVDIFDIKLLADLAKPGRVILASILQVFAPDLYAAARMGRTEAGQPLWKRLAYVAITRAQERLIWVVRNRLSKPSHPLRVDDLRAVPAAKLTLEAEET